MRASKLFATLDWLQIGAILVLLSLGIILLFGFSGGSGLSLGWMDLIYSAIGFSLMLVLTFIDYRVWRGLAWWLYLAGVILLGLVLMMGSHAYGAQRWIEFSFFKFQPSELVKLIFILILARFLAEREQFTLKHLIYLLGLLLLPVCLILSQPDLGTASVYLIIFLSLALVARLPRYYWLVLSGLFLIAMPLVWFNLHAYQRERLLAFLHTEQTGSAAQYNLAQSKIAIGSGGLWGRGVGQGTQSKLQFLPVAYSDFIFAAASEASGFFGAVLLIVLEFVLVWRCLRTAQLSSDAFGAYFSVGAASLFLYQTFINIGGNLGLVPVTGLPLPLVSFGGTGLISYLIILGIVQSIYLRHKKLSFE